MLKASKRKKRQKDLFYTYCSLILLKFYMLQNIKKLWHKSDVFMRSVGYFMWVSTTMCITEVQLGANAIVESMSKWNTVRSTLVFSFITAAETCLQLFSCFVWKLSINSVFYTLCMLDWKQKVPVFRVHEPAFRGHEIFCFLMYQDEFQVCEIQDKTVVSLVQVWSIKI